VISRSVSGDATPLIFQIARPTDRRSLVVLIGGAKSTNVFWQVGSSRAGNDLVFKGTSWQPVVALNTGRR
jgi:hypothetical protein